jgi:hypothetical protein
MNAIVMRSAILDGVVLKDGRVIVVCHQDIVDVM